MREWLLSLLMVLLVLVGAACSAGGTEPPDPPPSPPTEAAALPLLTPDFTLGTTLYGGADLSALDAPARALLDTAVARGLGGFTYYVDWPDLEPAPGQYALDPFTERLDALQRLGVRPFVNLTVGDIEDYNLPPALSDGQGGLAEGTSLSDPAVIDRFGQLLDRVVPLVLEHGGFALGVGNEVDERLDGRAEERAAYVQFVEAARERVHAIDARLAVAVTLTATAVRARTETFRALRPATDIIPFNYGPIQPDFFVRDLDAIRGDFQEVVDAHGPGPILIQELTCPSAASMNASEAWQRACFERLFAAIQATPQVRFASVFTLQDLDAETCALVRELIFGDELDDLPEPIAQRLADYLCELGVVAADGTPKPVWNEVLGAAASAAE